MTTGEGGELGHGGAGDAFLLFGHLGCGNGA